MSRPAVSAVSIGILLLLIMALMYALISLAEDATREPTIADRRADFTTHCVAEGGDPQQCVSAARTLMPATQQECEKVTPTPTVAECKELPNG